MVEKYRQYISGDSVILPYGLTEIEDNAFNGCTSVAHIEIPDSVTLIGHQSFLECSSLAEIEIPNSVTEIGSNAFWGCSGLSCIEIPNSVKKIGYGAFKDCISLTGIKIPSSVIEIENGAFNGCSNLDSIVVQKGNPVYVSKDNCLLDKESETILFAGCKYSIIPQGVTIINEHAFEGHTGLTSIKIPDSVTKIGCGSFASTGLMSIIIPASVKVIEQFAFSGCFALEKCDIPECVLEIKDEAFSDCPVLKEIYLRYNNPTEAALNGFCFDVYSEIIDEWGGYRQDYYKEDQFHNISLIVPIGAGYAYRHHHFFSLFKEVLPIL